ncbi:hypothetical protein [Streptosporangium amethystogenes]|uniref:hypothetical protein n=1 Tax=Streptosporangium amethystogenes TaxID=2002 RepID=UPI0012FB81BB|nr:hypothetical protein [Streptosporangium amethystogenes]
MYGEHDRTHGHGLNTRPRGRMPYSDSWLRPSGDPPRSAGPATLPEPDGRPAPHRAARHRRNEEVGDDVARSPAHRSWTYLDSRPFSMPPPPSPWRRPWSRLSRDQLLGPALIAGFLVAAGVGVWSSGWSPWAGTPTASTVPAPPAGRLLADHDTVFTPPRAPAAAGVGAGAKVSVGERGTSAGKGRAAGRRKAPRRAPARVMPAERTLAGPAGRSGNGWVKRVERRRESGEGRGSARTGAGSGKAGNTAPVTGSTGQGAGDAAGGTRGSAGSAASGRSRSGVRKARSQPRTARTGATTRSPSPSASRSRPPEPSAGGGSAAGISAAYACRHLPVGDWRYAYCVRVWNDYKSRNGLP